jgi:hypothetical protein
VSRERKREETRRAKRLAPRVSIIVLELRASALWCASVASGPRLKYCPQGQLHHPPYSLSRADTTEKLVRR